MPPNKGVNDSGEEIFLSAPDKIIELINSELQYELPDGQQPFSFQTSKNSYTLGISIVSSSKNNAAERLRLLEESLKKKYAQNLESVQDTYDQQIELERINLKQLEAKEKFERTNFNEELKTLKGNLKQKKETYQSLQNTIASYDENISDKQKNRKILLNNIERMRKNMEANFKNKNQKKDSLYMSSSIVGQNISMADSISNQILNLRKMKKRRQDSLSNIRYQIEILERKVQSFEELKKDKTQLELSNPNLFEIMKNITDSRAKIKSLEDQKKELKNIQTLVPPKTTPVQKTNNLNRNAALAFVASIFLLVFISFFIEYIQNARKQ